MSLQGTFNFQKPKIYFKMFFFFYFLQKRMLKFLPPLQLLHSFIAGPLFLFFHFVLFWIVQSLLLSFELFNQVQFTFQEPMGKIWNGKAH